MPRHRPLSVIASAVLLGACASGTVAVHRPGDGDSVPRSTVPMSMLVRPGLPFPESRCARNREAGKIVYLTPANYVASAGVVEVLLAKAKGYYDELCLDVTIVPSFTTENYPSVAANDAQFATAASFSELADFAGHNNARLVTLAVDGRIPLDVLIVRPGESTAVGQLRGKAIGVKGALTPGVAALFGRAGLRTKDVKSGTVTLDYSTVDVVGVPPAEALARTDLAALNGTLSDEAAELSAAQIPFQTVQPVASKVAGSFGVLFTNGRFMLEFPTAVEDFLRATSRGLRDALDDPVRAVEVVAAWIPPTETLPEEVQAQMTPFDVARETRRWTTEAALIRQRWRSGPPNLPLRSVLGAEARAGQAAGLFSRAEPNPDRLIDDLSLRAVYNAGGVVVWPQRKQSGA